MIGTVEQYISNFQPSFSSNNTMVDNHSTSLQTSPDGIHLSSIQMHQQQFRTPASVMLPNEYVYHYNRHYEPTYSKFPFDSIAHFSTPSTHAYMGSAMHQHGMFDDYQETYVPVAIPRLTLQQSHQPEITSKKRKHLSSDSTSNHSSESQEHSPKRNHTIIDVKQRKLNNCMNRVSSRPESPYIDVVAISEPGKINCEIISDERNVEKSVIETRKCIYLDHLPIRKRHHHANGEPAPLLGSTLKNEALTRELGCPQSGTPTTRMVSPLNGSDKNSSGYCSETDECFDESYIPPPRKSTGISTVDAGKEVIRRLQQKDNALSTSPKALPNTSQANLNSITNGFKVNSAHLTEFYPVMNHFAFNSKITPMFTVAGNRRNTDVALVNSINYQRLSTPYGTPPVERFPFLPIVPSGFPTMHRMTFPHQTPQLNFDEGDLNVNPSALSINHGTMTKHPYASQHLLPPIVPYSIANSVAHMPIPQPPTCAIPNTGINHRISIPKPITSVLPILIAPPTTTVKSSVSPDASQYAPLKRAPGRAKQSNHVTNDAAQLGENSYLCEVCNKVFPLQRLLNRHMKCHNATKRYQCVHCGKGFNDTFDLKRHVRTHTGVRPYNCEKCDKSFTQRCSLESHLSKVHGLNHEYIYKQRRSKLYVCEECGKTDTNVDDYYEHIKEKHPDSTELRKYQDKVQFQKLLKKCSDNKTQ
ncbi:uncharacterized protein LOC117121696 [Anneissia japonica]|uniref:uncharacterized protein LOC117121696 n=1 Tax=Anneissia japonica TaxID=1529436 RepID=UPI0014257CF5|nr:uncharacterized protein LOC117121696 [Anneissia japonica]